MALTLLKNHKGTDIFVDDSGKFSAQVKRGSHTSMLRRANLRDLEREIEQALPKASKWPGVDVMDVSVDIDGGWGGERPIKTPKKRRISGFREEKRTRGYLRSTDIVLLDASGLDLKYEGSLYPFDQEIFDRLTDIAAREKAIRDEWAAACRGLDREAAYSPYSIRQKIEEFEAQVVQSKVAAREKAEAWIKPSARAKS